MSNPIRISPDQILSLDSAVSEYWNVVLSSGQNQEVDDRQDASFLTLFDALDGFFTLVRKASGVKDKWGDPFIYPCRLGAGIIRISGKSHCDYIFGLDPNGFFLRAPIHCCYNLRYMTDDFWCQLTKLMQSGSVRFEDGVLPLSIVGDEKNKIILRNEQSVLFSMIRNSVLIEREQETRTALGNLELTWPSETGWNELAAAAAKAFYHLYRLNFLLYRRDYLRDKRLERRYAKFRQTISSSSSD